MKYSIVVCIYNGEKYIEKCFSSLLSQTYTNYEILVIDDGSTDKTSSLLKKYENYTNITIISQKNQGLSMSRNIGISKATGDYLLFVDVDDTVPSTFLETLEKNMEKDLDLIKFQYAYVYENGEKKSITSHFDHRVFTGCDAFPLLVSFQIPFELATIYAYRRKFWVQNHFSFSSGMYHEDYGLIPYVVLKSKKIKLLDDVLYYYYQSSDSITRNADYQKTVKKANDIFIHSQENKKKVSQESFSDAVKKIYYSYMANAILLKYKELKGKDRSDYRKWIKENGIVEDLLEDTQKRKIKKMMWKLKIR